MNYSQKRTLIGRIVYIGLTLMAVTILCVTMYTFFGSSRQAVKTPPITTAEADPRPPVTTDPPTTKPTEKDPPATSDSKPTVVPPAKDWLSQTLTMPVSGTVAKGHDLQTAVYSMTMNDYRVHRGVDLACSLGDDVLACAYGTVISIGEDPFMGTCLAIDHGDGLVSYYRNLAPTLAEGIEVGAVVHEGQILGAVGESAIVEIADEPHLHFELELNNEPIDPQLLFSADEK